MLSGWVWRDDGLAATLAKPVAQPSGVVGPVSDQLLWRGHFPEQRRHAVQVVGVTGSECEGDGAASGVGQGMNFGRPSAARSSDGIGVVPPFAPAAERCALT